MIRRSTILEVGADWLWRFIHVPPGLTISFYSHWSSRKTGRLKRVETSSVTYEGPKARFSMLSGHNQGSLDNAEDQVALRASSISLPNCFCDYNDLNI